jgi:hypothetical protein
MRVPLLFVLLLLTCCATPYQDMGLGGGVDAQKLSSDTYKIMAYGNALATPVLIRDYAMRKAAETTRQAGNSHFVILRQQYVGIGRFPGEELEIRVLTVSPGKPAPRGAFSANEVIKSLGDKKGAS